MDFRIILNVSVNGLGEKKSEFALEIWSFFIVLIIINYLLYTMHVNLSTQEPEY